MRRALLPAVLAASLLAAVLPAAADHTQAGVVFDHDGGNEWWVELQMRGDTRHDAAWVRDTGGAWKQMEQPSWAPNSQLYAVGYHVEPGHLVQFRATNEHDEVVSCWFTHPAGEERCDGTETEGFVATFRVSGDGNRIHVNATGTRPVAAVYMTVVGVGGYQSGGALPKLPDGSWGRTGYVPSGLVLQFTAEGPEPRYQSTSGCYRWPAVTQVACPSGFFSGWMENVHPKDGDDSVLQGEAHLSGGTLSKVQVRFDGGDFRTLTYVEEPAPWYRYAGAPTDGTHVAEFRFTSAEGDVWCDEVGHEWPQEGEWPFYAGIDGIVFAEAKGNENWVQVNTYSAPDKAVAVEAQVNGGPWRALSFQSWCDWAAAMSAPAGSSVRFRAFLPDLSSQTSAPVTWPPGGSTPPAGFDASFTNVKGNEWWIQASVSATGGTLAKVDVSLDGGSWKPLANKGWGWAASYHAPAGTVVQLRATSTAGATDLSGCYRWTTATPVECGGSTPPPSSFDATFSNVRGNEWWVETDVGVTGGTLAGVDARVNGGAWTALTKQSWGSWAKSIHASGGSTVEFRARATDGATDVSGAYRWPPG